MSSRTATEVQLAVRDGPRLAEEQRCGSRRDTGDVPGGIHHGGCEVF